MNLIIVCAYFFCGQRGLLSKRWEAYTSSCVIRNQKFKRLPIFYTYFYGLNLDYNFTLLTTVSKKIFLKNYIFSLIENTKKNEMLLTKMHNRPELLICRITLKFQSGQCNRILVVVLKFSKHVNMTRAFLFAVLW